MAVRAAPSSTAIDQAGMSCAGGTRVICNGWHAQAHLHGGQAESGRVGSTRRLPDPRVSAARWHGSSDVPAFVFREELAYSSILWTSSFVSSVETILWIRCIALVCISVISTWF